ERVPSQPSVGELGGELAFPEHEHAIHQVDELVEIGGQHHDGHAVAGEPAQQAIEVVLGAGVDTARRVVEQQYARLDRKPARGHDVLLVTAAQRRYLVTRVGKPDA